MRYTIQTIALVSMFTIAVACRAEDTKQRSFETPQAAFNALIASIQKNDDEAILDVLGHEHKDLVIQTDKEESSEIRKRIAEAAKEFLSVKEEGDKAVACMGAQCWPYPIPVVKKDGHWIFDTAAGKEEILNRRIGRHELRAIRFLNFYDDAQRYYASKDRTGDNVLKYAQKLISSKDKKDGLFWQEGARDEKSPLAMIIGDDREFLEGMGTDKPYEGYKFKILTRQGENPPNGKYDYVINGNMIAGFAIVAWPADYGSSGVMTFVMSHTGKIYQKDLGQDTPKIAGTMSEYNPDKTWTEVKPEDR